MNRTDGCVIRIQEKRMADMVQAVLSLGGIFPAADGALLVTDTLPERPEADICAVLWLTDEPVPAAYACPVRTIAVPFGFDELVRTAKSLLYAEAVSLPEPAAGKDPEPQVLEMSGGTVRLLNGTEPAAEAVLTARESALFRYFLLHRGEVLCREDVYREVWHSESRNTNLVDVYVTYLRRRLHPLFGEDFLLSVRGKGYRLRLPERILCPPSPD